MEKEEKKEFDERSLKDISDNWLSLIFNSMLELQESEINMTSGCSDIGEFVNVNVQSLTSGSKIDLETVMANVQLKNMQMMINHFDILLGNVRAVVEEKNYQILIKRLELIKKVSGGKIKGKDKKEIKITSSVFNQDFKAEKVSLEKGFYMVQGSLCQLRKDLVKELKPLLFVQDEEKGQTKRT